MNAIKNLIRGAVIGIANIIPGVSGGTMAVLLGIYDKLINAISLSKENIKKNWKFLLFIGLGVAIGIVAFANILEYCTANYNVPTQFAFIGLILGSFPFLWKITVSKKKFSPINIMPFIIACGSMFVISTLNPQGNIAQTQMSFSLGIILIVLGTVASISMIIPGLSGSFMLKAFGQYDTVTEAISRLSKFYKDGFSIDDILILVTFGIGALIGIIGGAKLISVALKKFHQGIYSAILGLVVGSVFVIFPKEFAFNTQGYIAIGTFLIGAGIALVMGKLNKE